jgi:DNA-binding HxlR family transcriptional regulator
MLYHILATLWDGPRDLTGLVADVGERTGEAITPAVLDGHVWFLFQFGFVDAYENDAPVPAPLYSLTPRGSDLLAISAAELEASYA